jgi:hypothetical protein
MGIKALEFDNCIAFVFPGSYLQIDGPIVLFHVLLLFLNICL